MGANKLIGRYRTILRKKLARAKVEQKDGSLKKICSCCALERKIQDKRPNLKSVALELQKDPQGQELLREYNFGKLLAVLERLLQEEQSQYQNKKPSQTDIKRWALKLAVLEYYKSLQVPYETPVLDSFLSGKTIHKYAPDKQSVYNIWLRKLSDLAKRNDINQVSTQEYDEAYNRGIPQGGAFERMLLRYRKEFVERLLQS